MYPVDKRLRIAGIAGFVAISIIILSSPSAPPPLPDPTTTTDQGNDAVEVLVTNLDEPRSITFATPNKLFLAEKSGNILVVENNTLLEKPLVVFRVPDIFNGGLLGIQAHPNFGDNPYLYTYHTYTQDGTFYNKITKITINDNQLGDTQVLLDNIPGSPFSNGGPIKFGPDGHLYIATGSVSDSSHLPQDPTSLVGKILRINPDDGSIPNTNPITDSPVYALGFRNPQGMAWDQQNNLYMVDMGPTKSDEINLVLPGHNYGWPEKECSSGGDTNDSSLIDPVLCFDPAIEPGGILIYKGDLLNINQKMVLSTLRASNLYALDLEEPGLQNLDIIFSGAGRIRDVAQSPFDGSLYLLTSNTDGKGFPIDDDDRLLRIVQ